MSIINKIKYSKFLFVFYLCCFSSFLLYAQSKGILKGSIADQTNENPLPGVSIRLGSSTYTTTGAKGRFTISAPAGTYTLKISFIGYRPEKRVITLIAGQTTHLSIRLKPAIQHLSGVEVSALPPSLKPTAHLTANSVREDNVRDAGELLRHLQGVDAVRRGPMGLDPSIRGLRESEIGFYVNGTRMFPGGPARMDSPLSHYDPNDIKSMEVVKGPYALTWGPGDLSAVKMKLKGAPGMEVKGLLHGNAGVGYNTNLNNINTSLSLFGRKNKIGYRVEGNWRKGADYTSGNGTLVPAHFRSEEIRGALKYNLNTQSSLTINGGVQRQHDLDYPGRILDAHYFHTYDVNGDYVVEWSHKVLRKIEIQGYFNHIKHQMVNADKPTAKPDSNRMPPFPLKVIINAESRTLGGKAAFTLVPSTAWHIEVGGNFYSNYRKAVRLISRRDKDNLLFKDLAWPGATVTMGGVYTYAQYSFNKVYTLSGTIRMDGIHNTADTVSDFFQDNVSNDLTASHFPLSGALTFNIMPATHWNISLGLGTVARSADATELYSDRLPSSKAQTSAEFVGNPQLLPERSYEADIWVSAVYPKFSFSANGFARQLHNYITLKPTSLPKRLPLDPNSVFAYRNGTADFNGFEISADYKIIPQLKFSEGISYLWGKDLTQDEPALGISPFRTDSRMRYQPLKRRFFIDGEFHTAGKQNRVAHSRGETPTAGYYTIAIKGGINITTAFSVQLGVENLTNQQYVDHLNSKDPYTGIPIPEPGRMFFANARFKF